MDPALIAFRAARAARIAAAPSLSCDGLPPSPYALPLVTPGMQAWQRHYPSPCGEACCFVPDCGRAVCAAGGPSCLVDVTPPTSPQPTRFTCLDPQCADTCGLQFLCEPCFSSPLVLHEHALFVRVDALGSHTCVTRPVGFATRAELLSPADLPRDPTSAAGECGLCAMEGTRTALGAGEGACVPGCGARHTGIRGLQPGPLCAPCVFGSLLGASCAFVLVGEGGGGGKAPCSECREEAQAAAFGAQAGAARAAARRAWVEALRGGAGGGEAWGSAAEAAAAALGLHRGDALFDPPAAVCRDGEDEGWAFNTFLEAAAAAFNRLHKQAHIRAAGAARLAPFPPPLRAADGGFTADTFLVRLPAIMDEMLAANPTAPAPFAAAVRSQLCAPLRAGGLLPPPPSVLDPAAEEEEGGLWGAHQGESERGTFWWQENAAYRHVMQLWLAHGGAGRDPFAAQKRAALAGAAIPFTSSVEPLLSKGEGPPPTPQLLRALLLRSLWGNKADLSLSSGKVVAAEVGAAAEAAEWGALLADDTARAVDVLFAAVAAAAKGGGSSSSSSAVAIVLDNCGLELLSDLALVDALLQLGLCVTLHAKRWPTFVSDALPCDVEAHLRWLGENAATGAGGRGAAARLQAAREEGRLRIAWNHFWNSAAASWEMPADLRRELGGCALAIVKGDANYRRLLGDRHWPHATPFQAVVGAYTPCPLLALRTCKAGLVVGVGEGEEERAKAARPEDWLTCGVFGVAQFAEPHNSRRSPQSPK